MTENFILAQMAGVRIVLADDRPGLVTINGYYVSADDFDARTRYLRTKEVLGKDMFAALLKWAKKEQLIEIHTGQEVLLVKKAHYKQAAQSLLLQGRVHGPVFAGALLQWSRDHAIKVT